MKIPISTDKYIIIAHQKGLLEIKDKAVILTKAGLDEMDAISEECILLMKDVVGADFDKMTESLSQAVGKKLTTRDTFQMVMLSMIGTEARLLAFLLNEKETNFVALTEAIKETMITTNAKTPTTPGSTTVTPFRRKPKLDS